MHTSLHQFRELLHGLAFSRSWDFPASGRWSCSSFVLFLHSKGLDPSEGTTKILVTTPASAPRLCPCLHPPVSSFCFCSGSVHSTRRFPGFLDSSSTSFFFLVIHVCVRCVVVIVVEVMHFVLLINGFCMCWVRTCFGRDSSNVRLKFCSCWNVLFYSTYSVQMILMGLER